MLIAGCVLLLLAALGFAGVKLNDIAERENRARYRTIVDTPTMPIAKVAAGGVVEIHGRAVASEQGHVVSPVSGRRVLLYNVIVFKWERGSGGTSRFSRQHTVKDRRELWLDDGSGERARIAPLGAQVILWGTRFAADHRTTSHYDRLPMHEAPLTQALHDWAVQFTGKPDVEHMIEERAIAEGDYLFAVGHAQRRDGVLVLCPTAERELLLSNANEQQLRAMYESTEREYRVWRGVNIAAAIAGAIALAIHFLSRV